MCIWVYVYIYIQVLYTSVCQYPAIPPYEVRTLHIRGIWPTEANNTTTGVITVCLYICMHISIAICDILSIPSYNMIEKHITIENEEEDEEDEEEDDEEEDEKEDEEEDEEAEADEAVDEEDRKGR